MAEANSLNSESAVFDANSLSVNGNYTFPTVDGTAGYFLTTDGLGAVSWAAGGTPVGGNVQLVTAITTSLINCTILMPHDDTIPQATEGTEVLTATITPTNAANKLLIMCNINGGVYGGQVYASFALFQDSTASAIAATQILYSPSDYYVSNASINYYMVAGTTSATTFKIRAGPKTSGDKFGVNGLSNSGGGLRKYGGKASTTITIFEIKV